MISVSGTNMQTLHTLGRDQRSRFRRYYVGLAPQAPRRPTYASVARYSHTWRVVENLAQRALHASDLTQRELAKVVGVSLRTVAGWLSGAEIPGPAEIVLYEIASGAPSDLVRGRVAAARGTRNT